MIGEMVLGLQSLVSHKPIRFALNLFITSAKEVVIVIFGVSVCLFVCLSVNNFTHKVLIGFL